MLPVVIVCCQYFSSSIITQYQQASEFSASADMRCGRECHFVCVFTANLCSCAQCICTNAHQKGRIFKHGSNRNVATRSDVMQDANSVETESFIVNLQARISMSYSTTRRCKLNRLSLQFWSASLDTISQRLLTFLCTKYSTCIQVRSKTKLASTAAQGQSWFG